MPPGLFITGTDTNVGKTYVAALIAKALVAAGRRVGVYKPAASGCTVVDGVLQSADARELWEAAGRPGELSQVCPQRFAAPLAPHLAAHLEGKSVDRSLLRTGLQHWLERSEIVLVEGAGGLLSPLSDQDYVADLAIEFGFPLVIVAANRLGTINASLQTLLTAKHFRVGLPVAGLILNDVSADSSDQSRASNFAELQARSSVPLLADVSHGSSALLPDIDWFALAGDNAKTR